jgi:uncharacterized protein (TIGR03067 family)
MRAIPVSCLTPLALGFVGFLAIGPDSAPAQTPLKPADLVGTYRIVGGEREGIVDPPERVEGSTVRFTAETVVVSSPDKKEVYSATYTLAPGDKPGTTRIHMTSRVPADKQEKAHGLIARDKDDTIRLIYALPGGEEPTEFRTKDQQLMFVMKPATE